jgi:hypothetical protein
MQNYLDDYLDEDEKIEKLKIWVDALGEKIRGKEITSTQALMEIKRIREKASLYFPDKLSLFDQIYQSRIKRLIEQFLKE